MTVRILTGDCRAVLASLPAESVHCVVTSPPYFGLRDYGTAKWEGGDPECDHRVWGHASDKPTPGGRGGSMPKQEVIQRETCSKCGARRIDSQIGLEPTPDEYVAEMVAVFREVRRVLRKDGTVWLNLGDSYAGSWGAQGRGGPPSESSTLRGNGHVGGGPKIKSLSAVQIEAHPKKESRTGSIPDGSGLKPKDLIGIPWRVAFALQADGWWLRSSIIWAKPNPMPESVTDRPTSAHENIFLLTKSPTYYFDAEAVREPNSEWSEKALVSDWTRRSRNACPNRNDGTSGNDKAGVKSSAMVNPAGRNIRNVWTIATQPYSEAHFATFPPALIEPCIKAGCPAGGTVLDPFGGAGTTGLVADRLGRNAILIELNPEYAAMAERRLARDGGMFAHVERLAL